MPSSWTTAPERHELVVLGLAAEEDGQGLKPALLQFLVLSVESQPTAVYGQALLLLLAAFNQVPPK